MNRVSILEWLDEISSILFPDFTIIKDEMFERPVPLCFLEKQAKANIQRNSQIFVYEYVYFLL